MKISLSWLKQYVDITVPVQELCDKMVMSGFEVEEIAGLTGSTPEAVRMNLSRARKRVREQFFKMQTL